jgi:hypothetical protein
MELVNDWSDAEVRAERYIIMISYYKGAWGSVVAKALRY